MPSRDIPKLADDLLLGAQAIADELGINLRIAFYMLERGQIPAKKIGDRWTALRSELRQHFSGGGASDGQH